MARVGRFKTYSQSVAVYIPGTARSLTISSIRVGLPYQFGKHEKYLLISSMTGFTNGKHHVSR